MLEILGSEVKTPWGSLAVLVDGQKQPVVIGAAFLSIDKFIAKYGQKLAVNEYRKDKNLAGVRIVLDSWLDGDLNAFNKLKVRQPGGKFMQACWAELRKIKSGSVISYAELAASAGRPLATRAAGTACATNLIAPIIPCHRVIKTGGALGNYGYGLKLKAALLHYEGVKL